MDWTSTIAVHESASPQFLREQVCAALRKRRIHPYLLYSGLKQAGLWTALHHAVSPAQRDPGCEAIYAEAFAHVTQSIKGNVAHVVSLACGDGTKDARCLEQIRASGRAGLYTPVDISLDLVLGASRHAAERIRGLQATPLICDLARCSVLPAILKGFDPSGAERIVLFLGTIHNFWPPEILRAIAYPVRSQDQLLISANLAPEQGYDAALHQILSQYENSPTRAWLMGALSELGIGPDNGELRIGIQTTEIPTLKRIEACFFLRENFSATFCGERFEFRAGEQLTVFFSHRFIPAHIKTFAHEAGFAVDKIWIDPSEQEGLFLCKRLPAS